MEEKTNEGRLQADGRDARIVTFGGADDAAASAGQERQAERPEGQDSQEAPHAVACTTDGGRRRKTRVRIPAACKAAAGFAAAFLFVLCVVLGVHAFDMERAEVLDAADQSASVSSEQDGDGVSEAGADAAKEGEAEGAEADGNAAASEEAAAEGDATAQATAGETETAAQPASAPDADAAVSSASASSGSSGGQAAGEPTSGSASSGETPAAEPEAQKVALSVDSSAANGSVSFDGSVPYQEGMSVFDALVASGVSYNARTSQFGVYVSAIGGLAEKDYGGQSGWKYSVNGEVPMVSASSYALKAGDVVRWFYTTTG